MLATLWFNIAHYTIRPWPWIIVALAALVILPRAQNAKTLKEQEPELYKKVEEVYVNKSLYRNKQELVQDKTFMDFYEKYENTVDPGVMYPKLMARYLPSGLLGLLIAVFMSAYMSTIASQLNWGTSYVINDLYRRFLNRNGSETHYVIISKIFIIFLVLVSLLVSRYFLTTISGAWIFILNVSAGLGGVLILRWYWWRINAWSEISAMIAPFIIYPLALNVLHLEPPLTLYPVVIGTTIVWLLVTFLTKPVNKAVLLSFYRKVYPGGAGWKKIAGEIKDITSHTYFGRNLVNWLCSVTAIYATMYGAGKILFSEYVSGAVALIIAFVASFVVYLNIKK